MWLTPATIACNSSRPTATLLTTWAGLHAPAGIALDGLGNLYVADSTADRVVELAPDGIPLGSWGTSGVALGQFRQPLGVAVDQNSGTIYVADTLNNRVVRIDRGELNDARRIVAPDHRLTTIPGSPSPCEPLMRLPPDAFSRGV